MFWLDPSWPFLHGVPAFFLALVVLVMISASSRLAVGTFRNGPGWLVSRGAMRTALLAGALVVSVVVLFYSVELWRGKRAWAAVAHEAARCGESLDLKSLVPPPVPEDQDFANAPLFAPLSGAVSVVRHRGHHSPACSRLGAPRSSPQRPRFCEPAVTHAFLAPTAGALRQKYWQWSALSGIS